MEGKTNGRIKHYGVTAVQVERFTRIDVYGFKCDIYAFIKAIATSKHIYGQNGVKMGQD